MINLKNYLKESMDSALFSFLLKTDKNYEYEIKEYKNGNYKILVNKCKDGDK